MKLAYSKAVVILDPDDFETGDTLKPQAQKAVDESGIVIYRNRVIKNIFDSENTVASYSWLDREFIRNLQPLVQDIVKDRIARGYNTEEITTPALQAVKAVTSAFKCFS
ncbi:hypothetical protein MOQ95_003498 [Salmonella enterica]|nr:hypothetical protein [Salmonella enterica]